MKDQHEPIHLCPICHCVEMVFVERIARDKYKERMRRFKCPVCDHQEMYVCSGPHDADRQRDALEIAKQQKETNYARRKNLFGRESYET
jgi:hypothetical protein